MKKYFIFLSIIFVFTFCQKREWDDPFDPDCPKEIWTPTDFASKQQGNEIILTWNQKENNISGFRIDRKVDGKEPWVIAISPDKTGINWIETNITGGKLYEYRLVALAGANESNYVTSQITPILTATLSTDNPSSLNPTSATLSTTITSDGGAPISGRGICWGSTQNPTLADNKTNDGTGTGSFASSITNLNPGATYYARGYATNSIGTVYGNQVLVIAPAILPSITSSTASILTFSTALSGGNVINDGGAKISSKGVCWSIQPNPTIADSKTSEAIGTGTGNFASNLTGLSINRPYYVRAYATNAMGTSYGNEIRIILYMNTPGPSVTDIDGNVYKTVKIGTQIWMAENLKVTKYRNGTAISNVTNGTTWANLTSGAYCNYDNISSNATIFGRLYNYYAVAEIRQLCPEGWHVPDNEEWLTLFYYLGDGKIAEGSLKEAGTSHWISPNVDATNSSGFTALPGGDIFSGADNNFHSLNSWGSFWSKTELDNLHASHIPFDNNNTYGAGVDVVSVLSTTSYLKYIHKSIGYSIRCIKD